ncbi:MAG: bacteriohemerythrin [Spirochaeta sp.]
MKLWNSVLHAGVCAATGILPVCATVFFGWGFAVPVLLVLFTVWAMLYRHTAARAAPAACAEIRSDSHIPSAQLAESAAIAAYLEQQGSKQREALFQTTQGFERVGEAVREIAADTDIQLAAASESAGALQQIMSGSKVLTEQLRNQHEVVSDTTSAIEEMFQTIQSITDNAEKIQQKMQELRGAAASGRSTLGTLNTAVQRASRQSKSLEQANRLIDNIAAQTHLLAINAAIEAAKVGQHGAGFAVVAGEIRSLAAEASAGAAQSQQELTELDAAIIQMATEFSQMNQVFSNVEQHIDTVYEHQHHTMTALKEQQLGSSHILDSAQRLQQTVEMIEEQQQVIHEATERTGSKVSDLHARSDANNTKVQMLIENAARLQQIVEVSAGWSLSIEQGLSVMHAEFTRLAIAEKTDVDTRFFRWNNDLATHVPLFDEQHQELIRILNDMHTAVVEGQGRQKVGEILDRLLQYTDYHFTCEEQSFQEYGYPECELHTQIHRKLVASVLDLKARFEQGSNAVVLETLQVLRAWLINHIRDCDGRYKGFFAAGRSVSRPREKSTGVLQETAAATLI